MLESSYGSAHAGNAGDRELDDQHIARVAIAIDKAS